MPLATPPALESLQDYLFHHRGNRKLSRLKVNSADQAYELSRSPYAHFPDPNPYVKARTNTLSVQEHGEVEALRLAIEQLKTWQSEALGQQSDNQYSVCNHTQTIIAQTITSAASTLLSRV